MPAAKSPDVDDRTRALRAVPEHVALALDGSGTMMLPDPLAALEAAAGLVYQIANDQPAAQPQPNPHPQPRQFLSYELHEMIGQGGMGAVYKAVHPWRGRTVAIKFLASQ